jgi:hypothetical protein
MALAAGDAQILYDEEQVYAATHDPDTIQRLQSHMSGQTHSNVGDGNPTEKGVMVSDSQIDYRYLDWNTPIEKLCSSPSQLPHSVTSITDPFTWGSTHKNIVLALACWSTFMAAYTAGAYTSGMKQMEHEWGIGRVPLLVGVTAYTTGFAIAPMFLAPISEVSQFLARILRQFFVRLTSLGVWPTQCVPRILFTLYWLVKLLLVHHESC